MQTQQNRMKQLNILLTSNSADELYCSAAKCHPDYPLTTSVNKQSTKISSVTNAQSDRFFCPLGLKIDSGVLSQALSHSAMVAELLAPANYYSLSKT